MEKTDLGLEFKAQKKTITYNKGKKSEGTFKMYTFIGVTAQFLLITKYLDAYFNSEIDGISDVFISEWDYIGAENVLMLEVLDSLTNIECDGINLDAVVQSGIWDLVKSNIKNYSEFRGTLGIMVSNAEREVLSKRSVGAVIDRLSEQVMGLLSKLSEIDLSEDGVKKLMESIGGLNETLGDSVLSPLIEDLKRK